MIINYKLLSILINCIINSQDSKKKMPILFLYDHKQPDEESYTIRFHFVSKLE